MLDTKQQKNIEKKNKEISDAILMSQMMDHKGFKVFKKFIENKANEIRFQDIFGIKDDALKDQKGIAMGIMQVISYFEDIQKDALKPRRDPITGEPEVLNAKKK